MGLVEDRAALQAANDSLGEALAVAMATAAALEEASGQAAQAIQGYDNTALVEATGLIAAASEDAGEVTREIAAAQQRLEEYIQQMS